MRSAKHVLSKDNLRTLYFALMYPYIDYGIILWGIAAKCHIYPLYGPFMYFKKRKYE